MGGNFPEEVTVVVMNLWLIWGCCPAGFLFFTSGTGFLRGTTGERDENVVVIVTAVVEDENWVVLGLPTNGWGWNGSEFGGGKPCESDFSSSSSISFRDSSSKRSSSNSASPLSGFWTTGEGTRGRGCLFSFSISLPVPLGNFVFGSQRVKFAAAGSGVGLLGPGVVGGFAVGDGLRVGRRPFSSFLRLVSTRS